MRVIKPILAISLIFNLLFVGYYVKKRYYRDLMFEKNTKKDLASNTPSYYLNRDELLASMAIDSNSIVFLGNSLTQYFPLEEMFCSTIIKNRGISGDVIEGVLKRLQPITKSNPSKIFIEIGINDLAKGSNENEVFVNYLKLINEIKTKSPRTKIYVQSIFPIQNTRSGVSSNESKSINKKIIFINSKLKEMSEYKDFKFVDTYAHFQLNGELNSKFSVDGVHLNSKGYILWKTILNPFITE